MSTQILGGAVNPYALAEVVLNKRIAWNKIEQPLALLEKTLETPAAHLFDPGNGSPVFATLKARPQRAVKAKKNGKVKANGAPSTVAKLDLSARISPALRKRLTEILVPLNPAFKETEYPGATWTDPGDFFDEGTEFGDPVQGAVGDCWLIAALSAVAWTRPYAIAQRNRTTGAANEQFVDAIDFANGQGNETFEVSEKVPVSDGTLQPLYARSAEAGEIWPCVYEKAYAKFRSGNLTDKPDIRSLGGGDCVDASAKLVPGLSAQYTWTKPTTADALWSILQANSVGNPAPASPFLALRRAGRTVNPMTAWTYGQASDAPDAIAYDAASGIVGNHCYSILGWITLRPMILVRPGRAAPVTTRYIVLRNPWGMHEGKVDALGGDWSAQDVSWLRTTPLNSAGVFALPIETFKKYYAGFGVAK